MSGRGKAAGPKEGVRKRAPKSKANAEERTIALPLVSRFDFTRATRPRPKWRHTSQAMSRWSCSNGAQIEEAKGEYWLTFPGKEKRVFATMLEAVAEGERDVEAK